VVAERVLEIRRPRAPPLVLHAPAAPDDFLPRVRPQVVVDVEDGPGHRGLGLAHVGACHFDRVGLQRLCGYGARGPISEERLTRLPSGLYRWQPKRGPALTLTAVALVKRLVALVPPRGLHLTCIHGVFAPNARLRRVVMQAPPPPPASVGTPAPAVAKRRRLDWAAALQLALGVVVWRCPCGGARRSRAVVTQQATAEAMLRSMGLLPPRTPLPRSHAPPQRSLGF
jgi:hypothetical protein